jgi:diguanylate cyclase (GGDEF)-like protein
MIEPWGEPKGLAMRRERPSMFVTASDEPFDRYTLFRLVGPLIAVFLASLLATAGGPGALDPQAALTAALLIASTAAAAAFAPWQQWSHELRVLPALGYVIGAFLISMATAGRIDFGAIVLLPVVWLAVYGSRRELITLLAAIGLIEIARLTIPGPTGGDAVPVVFQVAAATILGLVVHQVVEEVRRQAGHLRSLARSDGLTGVANRRAWDEELVRAVRAAGPHSPLALALLDVDDFKLHNDRGGHQAGDRLLREVTAAWSALLRKTDILARIGGDEFAVLLRDCSADAARDVMERLRVSTPEGVTSSVGLASWEEGEPAQALWARADAALYRAKASGRDRVEVWRGSGRLVRP